jgi:ribonucleoside-triphosphate reductase
MQMLRKTELMQQVYNVFFEVGKTTGEFDSDVAWAFTNEVIEKLKDDKLDSFSAVENEIEAVLLRSPYHASAKTVIVARDRRDHVSELVRQAEIDRVDQYLSKLDWEVRESSNMSYSLQGLNHYLSRTIGQHYWLNKIYPE